MPFFKMSFAKRASRAEVRYNDILKNNERVNQFVIRRFIALGFLRLLNECCAVTVCSSRIVRTTAVLGYVFAMNGCGALYKTFWRALYRPSGGKLQDPRLLIQGQIAWRNRLLDLLVLMASFFFGVNSSYND